MSVVPMTFGGQQTEGWVISTDRLDAMKTWFDNSPDRGKANIQWIESSDSFLRMTDGTRFPTEMELREKLPEWGWDQTRPDRYDLVDGTGLIWQMIEMKTQETKGHLVAWGYAGAYDQEQHEFYFGDQIPRL